MVNLDEIPKDSRRSRSAIRECAATLKDKETKPARPKAQKAFRLAILDEGIPG